MGLDLHFGIVFVLFAVYIVLGNYLYFWKILPAIERAGGDSVPAFLPSGQFRQTRRYVDMLDQRNDRPWYYFFLRFDRHIALVLVLLWLSLLLRLVVTTTWQLN